MTTDPNILQQEFRVLLKRSKTAKPEELPAICERLSDYIKRGVPLYDPSFEGYNPPLLWILIESLYPLEIIECIYNGNKSLAYINLGTRGGYNDSESRDIIYEKYDLQIFLSRRYGYHFFHMTDDSIEDIEYFLACLKILNIKEKDFDWAISRKYGEHD